MKAIVIGGSSGIGLAVSKNLIEQGYQVTILGRSTPELCDQNPKECLFEYCDLNYLDIDQIARYATDAEVGFLMITAGIGRLAPFESFEPFEVKKTMTVNAAAFIEILQQFSNRIQGEAPFYCGVVSSISGLLASPMAAAYAASKAAICRYVESVNIELEMAGHVNRITNIAPGYIPGTGFYGGEDRQELLSDLAAELVANTLLSRDLYIPQYDDVYRTVLERYHNDPHEFGVQSYQYKKTSGRLEEQSRMKIGYLSGTFDLFHVGHLNLLRRAKQYCDYLIVGVHDSGAWKGKETFIPFAERMQIVGACKYVDKVVESCREDSDAWDRWRFHRLFVGSDYKGTDRFKRYEEFFKDKGVEIIYFPYTQSTSSTKIRGAITERSAISD